MPQSPEEKAEAIIIFGSFLVVGYWFLLQWIGLSIPKTVVTMVVTMFSAFKWGWLPYARRAIAEDEARIAKEEKEEADAKAKAEALQGELKEHKEGKAGKDDGGAKAEAPKAAPPESKKDK